MAKIRVKARIVDCACAKREVAELAKLLGWELEWED